MKRTKAREIVSQPYTRVTAFHRHPVKRDSGRLKWAIDVLAHFYGLAVPADRRRIVESPDGSDYTIASLVTSFGDPFLFVGTAGRDTLPECEDALRRRLLLQQTATFGIVSDGAHHIFLRRRHDADRCEYAPDLPKASNAIIEADLFGYPAGRYEARSAQRSLESIFFEVHSTIRDVDGMHDDEALDELCKIIFSILVSTSDNQDAFLQPFSRGAQPLHPAEHSAVLRGMYARAVDSHQISAGEAFEAPIRLSDASLMSVWRALAECDLAGASTDVKGRAFQKVLDPAIRAGMGQFFTPDPVVDFMVDAVAPAYNERVLDPFCGSGHFLTRSLERVSREELQDRRRLSSWARSSLHGIEKSPRMIRVSRTDQLLRGNYEISLHCADALAPFQNFATLEPDSFDVVLTNPPFGSLLGVNAAKSLGPFDLARGKSSTPVDVLGLERAVQFLRPGGRLAIVLPDGMFSNQRLRYVRDWLVTAVSPVAMIMLPTETFSPFGANVRTAVLFGIKRKGNISNADEPVLIGGAESVGYDASGRPSARKSDLAELAVLVRDAFAGRERTSYVV